MDIAFILETLQVILIRKRSSGSSKTAIVVKDLKSQMDFHLTIEEIGITAVKMTLWLSQVERSALPTKTER